VAKFILSRIRSSPNGQLDTATAALVVQIPETHIYKEIRIVRTVFILPKKFF